jgi:glycosyltransferase involved in cell wall biosynthesis/SAM-dependent methyltransferase
MSDDYYKQLFTKDPQWSSKQPNPGELLRWSRIAVFLDQIVGGLKARLNRRPRILEVGSGRGWLTNLLNSYGDAMGVEPVAFVVEHARILFPQNCYVHGTTETLIASEPNLQFDIIVSSEVVEHVPDAEKSAFVQSMFTLLASGGFIVITTPRKEVLAELLQRGFNIDQPVEDWLTENELRDIYASNGLVPLHINRIFARRTDLGGCPPDVQTENEEFLALYQVWLFQKQMAQSTVHAETSDIQSLDVVSVVIPTYNRLQLLRRAVNSVMSQTMGAFELIIVDDGSKDLTSSWVRSLADKRIRFVQHQINQGQNAALNTGIALARGRYLAFLDSDDEWLPNFLQEFIDAFHSDPEIGAVYCHAGARMLDGTLKSFYTFTLSGYVYSEALAQGYLSHMITLMIKRSCLKIVGDFDPQFTVCQDDDFCFRVAKHNKVKLIPKILAVIHSDGGSDRVITNSKQKYAEGWWKLFDKYRDEILQNCGCEIMASHYIKCGKLFLDAGDLIKALESFSLSARCLDYRINENLPLQAKHLTRFVPEGDSLRRNQVDGLRLCAELALRQRSSV